MKYIKEYKVFENASGLREELMDLLANLHDDGYFVRFAYMGNDNGYLYIIGPGSVSKPIPFNFDNIKGDFLRMVDFLEDRYLVDIGIREPGSMLDYKTTRLEDLKVEKHGKVYGIKVNLYSKEHDNQQEKLSKPK